MRLLVDDALMERSHDYETISIMEDTHLLWLRDLHTFSTAVHDIQTAGTSREGMLPTFPML
jgi:hypothetical protein